MALDLADYEKKSAEAVMAFWGNREKARQKQIEAGKADQGERAGVTAGPESILTEYGHELLDNFLKAY